MAREHAVRRKEGGEFTVIYGSYALQTRNEAFAYCKEIIFHRWGETFILNVRFIEKLASILEEKRSCLD
jgi:hypothetical protein